jgi:WhiB family transcriptional regulator, redox-sensing transcriptional regulator
VITELGITQQEEWKLQALCTDTDPELFFPEQGEEGKKKAAIRICQSCPVRQECLRWAFRTGEKHGIWGGLTSVQRSRIKTRVLRSIEDRC